MSPEVAAPVKTLRLEVVLPTEVLVDEEVRKVVAEAENGAFCLLPRHVDFVAALRPGLLCFVNAHGREGFAALDQGILVKCGREVLVSTLSGVRGTDLHHLAKLLADRVFELDEHERRSRSALARLEAGALRGFRRLQEGGHG